MPSTGTIAVLTADLIRFEILADYWTTESIRSGETLIWRVRLRIAGQDAPVAEFGDVHAVWYLSKGDIVQPDERDRIAEDDS